MIGEPGGRDERRVRGGGFPSGNGWVISTALCCSNGEIGERKSYVYFVSVGAGGRWLTLLAGGSRCRGCYIIRWDDCLVKHPTTRCWTLALIACMADSIVSSPAFIS